MARFAFYHERIMTYSQSRITFTLLVLFGINTMNFYDRQILGVVQEQLPSEWNLTHSDKGWLGTSFILIYAAIGLPLGRLADVWQRKWLLAAGVALWSLLTAVSGWAWSFWSLFVFRMGVGVGEAICAPACSSLIGDLFQAKSRARAMSVFMLGLPVGLGLSFFLSGRITQAYGWQTSFFIAGVPGLLLAFAAFFMLEPARGSADALAKSTLQNRLPFWTVAKNVLRLPTMWWIIISGALHNFNMYALGSFLVSFLQLYYGVKVEVAGDIGAITYGFGAVSMFVAGWLGDRAFHRHVSGRLRIAWQALGIAVPFLLLAFSLPPTSSAWLFALCFLPASMMLYAYYGTVYASIQDIIAPQFRGMAMAIYFFAMYMLGAVLGPIGMGKLSDFLSMRAANLAGVQVSVANIPLEYRAIGIHQAMFIVPILCALLVIVLFAASRTVARDREKLLSESQ